MIGKKYKLSLEKIKSIYEGVKFLDVFAELKIDGTYSYRLGRLRDHLEPIMTRFAKTEKQWKQAFKGEDGKIDVQKHREALEDILDKEYEGVYIPEFKLSGFCTKDDGGTYKLAVPQKLISALSFHIIDDINKEDEGEYWKTPVPVIKEEVIEKNIDSKQKEIEPIPDCEYIPE